MQFKFDWVSAFNQAFSGERKLLDVHMEQAFKEVLLPFITNKSKSKSDAEEIACESLTKFWERFYILKEPLPENVNGYLYTIGLNSLFNYYRMKNKFTKRTISVDTTELSQKYGSRMAEDYNLESFTEKETMYKAMELGLAKMCQSCKEILRLYIFENKKLKDIYKELNMPTANAASKKKTKCINKLIKYTYKELDQMFLKPTNS